MAPNKNKGCNSINIRSFRIYRSLFLLALALLLAIGTITFRAHRVPRSDGHSLGYWLDVLDSPIHTNLEQKRIAKHAIVSIGIEAQPFLKERLSRRDSKVLQNLESFVKRYTSLELNLSKAREKRRKAIWGYFILADATEPQERLQESTLFPTHWNTLMELRQRYKSEWPEVREYVEKASRVPPPPVKPIKP